MSTRRTACPSWATSSAASCSNRLRMDRLTGVGRLMRPCAAISNVFRSWVTNRGLSSRRADFVSCRKGARISSLVGNAGTRFIPVVADQVGVLGTGIASRFAPHGKAAVLFARQTWPPRYDPEGRRIVSGSRAPHHVHVSWSRWAVCPRRTRSAVPGRRCRWPARTLHFSAPPDRLAGPILRMPAGRSVTTARTVRRRRTG